jgi:hypothetical protein
MPKRSRDEVQQAFTDLMKRSVTEEENIILQNLQKMVDKALDYEEDIENGMLLKQGTIPGTQHGYICHVCADSDANHICDSCNRPFCDACYDIDEEQCEACVEKDNFFVHKKS